MNQAHSAPSVEEKAEFDHSSSAHDEIKVFGGQVSFTEEEERALVRKLGALQKSGRFFHISNERSNRLADHAHSHHSIPRELRRVSLLVSSI